MRQERVGAVPVVATHPMTALPSRAAIAAAGFVSGPVAAGVAAAVVSDRERSRDAALVEGISDPSAYLSSRVQSTLVHHLGVRFVPVSANSYRRTRDGQSGGVSEGAPAFSFSVMSRGFGIRQVKGSPEDRAVFYRGDVVLADWSGHGAQPMLEKSCQLESLLVLSRSELGRTSGKVWLQERLNHLATHCVRLFEEEVCRRARPDVPLERCATTPREPEEAEEVDD